MRNVIIFILCVCLALSGLFILYNTNQTETIYQFNYDLLTKEVMTQCGSKSSILLIYDEHYINKLIQKKWNCLNSQVLVFLN